MTADLMVAVFKKAIAENELTGAGIHSIMEKGFTFTSPQRAASPTTTRSCSMPRTDCGSVVYVEGTVYQIKAPQVCSTKYLKVK